MTPVILLGELGRKYGRRFKLDVRTPAEAVRALAANFPDFEKTVLAHKAGFRVLIGREECGESELLNPAGRQSITIVPMVAGAGGLGKIILGAALITASFYIPGSMAAIDAALMTGVSVTTMATFAFTTGVSLALQGTAEMLAPNPVSNGPQERPENQPSYVFNGPVNTTAQGHPVPVGYGRLRIGSAVISAGITTEEISA